MYYLLLLIAILLAVISGLLIKLHLMHKAVLEITEAFRSKVSSDTNTLMDISSRDPYMRQLAADLNVQLRLLRKQRHRYLAGDRELKEAVTNISHDLRTPLTAICGYMDLIQREDTNKNVRRYLSLIENRVLTMKQLTEELFHYSIIVSTEELTMETVHVNSVLEESIAAFYGAFTSRGLEPDISITPCKIERRLNRDALSRVFGNILSNALKYSSGDLTISLNNRGELVFSNMAPGMDEVQAGRLFERFYTVETAASSRGLGLSISKSLVEQMGGIISASVNEGSLSIHIHFP